MLTGNRVNPLQPFGDIKNFMGSVVWFLLWADDPATVAGLEWAAGCSQAAVVDHFIEDTCWWGDCAGIRDHRGTPAERLAHLRRVMQAAGLEPFRLGYSPARLEVAPATGWLPEMQAALDAANQAVGALIDLARVSADPHAVENGSIAWEAYALLSLIKLDGEPRISNPRRVTRDV
jgi:hypothetical protein